MYSLRLEDTKYNPHNGSTQKNPTVILPLQIWSELDNRVRQWKKDERESKAIIYRLWSARVEQSWSNHSLCCRDDRRTAEPPLYAQPPQCRWMSWSEAENTHKTHTRTPRTCAGGKADLQWRKVTEDLDSVTWNEGLVCRILLFVSANLSVFFFLYW